MTKKLKCWKKTLNETNLVHFYNKKNRKRLRLESVFINNAPNEWQIRSGGFSFGKTGKVIKHSIKTKSQALKFAKSYMKKHNKC